MRRRSFSPIIQGQHDQSGIPRTIRRSPMRARMPPILSSNPTWVVRPFQDHDRLHWRVGLDCFPGASSSAFSALSHACSYPSIIPHGCPVAWCAFLRSITSCSLSVSKPERSFSLFRVRPFAARSEKGSSRNLVSPLPHGPLGIDNLVPADQGCLTPLA